MPHTDSVNARIEEEIATYADLYGSAEAERLRPYIAAGIRENRPPGIKMSETQRRAIDARRTERAETARAMDRVIADFIASEHEAGVFEAVGAGTERPEDPGHLTPEQEAAAVSVLLGEDAAPASKLSPDDEAAALRLSEGV